ncbi:hypothetical protein ACA910_014232 [Epithemia clementina (nom. ined.)]
MRLLSPSRAHRMMSSICCIPDLFGCRNNGGGASSDKRAATLHHCYNRWPLFPHNIKKHWISSITSSSSQSQKNAELNLGITNAQKLRGKMTSDSPSLPPTSTLRRRRIIHLRKRSSPRISGTVHPVSAIHLGQSIDMFSVRNKVFPSSLETGKQAKLSDKKSLVLELPQAQSNNNMNNESRSSNVYEPPRYIAVYGFGSVVGLNIPSNEFQYYLGKIRQFVVDPVKPGLEKKEDFGVILQPMDLYPSHVMEAQEESSPIITGDYCVMSTLDVDGVAVISNIMAQTVALDTYNDTADDFLNRFAAINSSVRATGKFKASDRSFLFKSVAHNNAIFIDMISKIRLKDRSDTAWKITKYEDIHYGLKSEFEIDDRFDQIEYKLNLIQQNSKFFLQVLASDKSNSLEWTIVILIIAECILMCVEMSGMGGEFISSFLSYFSQPFRPPHP